MADTERRAPTLEELDAFWAEWEPLVLRIYDKHYPDGPEYDRCIHDRDAWPCGVEILIGLLCDVVGRRRPDVESDEEHGAKLAQPAAEGDKP
jgi:hypothetical protein